MKTDAAESAVIVAEETIVGSDASVSRHDGLCCHCWVLTLMECIVCTIASASEREKKSYSVHARSCIILGCGRRDR